MAHIHEKIDFVVSAFIVHEEKVLLVHHIGQNRWLPVGGHIELDEDTDQALFREIKEETGLTQDQLAILSEKADVAGNAADTKFLYRPAYLDLHRINETHRHLGIVFFLKAKSDEVTLASEEHHEIRWFSESELGEKKYDVSDAIKFYALEALTAAR